MLFFTQLRVNRGTEGGKYKDGGRPRREGLIGTKEKELKGSICPATLQGGQKSWRNPFSQPRGESVCVYCIYIAIVTTQYC